MHLYRTAGSLLTQRFQVHSDSNPPCTSIVMTGSRTSPAMQPVAKAEAVVGGGKDQPYRFTVLTDGLIRFEYAADCVFEDRASTFATNRNLPVPKFRVNDKE